MYLRFSEHFSGEGVPGYPSPSLLKEAQPEREGSGLLLRNFVQSAKERPRAAFCSPFPLSLF